MRSRRYRTQEVAGSSPASSIRRIAPPSALRIAVLLPTHLQPDFEVQAKTFADGLVDKVLQPAFA